MGVHAQVRLHPRAHAAHGHPRLAALPSTVLGQWLELREITFPWASADRIAISDSPLPDWSEKARIGASIAGTDTTACQPPERHLRAIGFPNPRKETSSFPLDIWPRAEKAKELGAYALENPESGLLAISTAVFSRSLGMQSKGIELDVTESIKHMHNPRSHYYAPL